MRNQFKYLLFLSLFALFFTSCQNEVVEETVNEEETFDPTSAVANLMLSTASNNTSIDNVMDGTDCFSVNLPVTIVANGVTITIDSLEDLEVLEEIFDEFSDDDDILEYLFPITIVLNDYTEITINNEDELEAFIEECTDDIDDEVECVDFVYPISFSLYDSAFQILDTVVIESDEALYEFLEELEEDFDDNEGVTFVSLNFPVSLVYADGSVVEVNNNQELEAALNDADDFCEDDDDYGDCDVEEVEMYLLECEWEIDSFNGDDNLEDYDIEFNEDGTLTIDSEYSNEIITGNWDLTETDDGLVLSLDELTALQDDLGGDWLIIACEDDYIKVVRENNAGNTIYVELERECEDDDDIDCSAQEVSADLTECLWYSNTNAVNNDFYGPWNFNSNGTVSIQVPNENPVTGQWNISLTDEGVFLVLELPEPYAEVSGEWELYECDDYFLKFIIDDFYLMFEQDCENDEYCDNLQAYIGDECETPNGQVGYINENCECEVEDDTNPFECYDDVVIALCDDDVADGFTEFDLNMVFPNCVTDDVEVTFHGSYADAEMNVEAFGSSFTNTSNPQTIYARITLAGNPDEYLIKEVTLVVEDCNQGSCTEETLDAYLMECYWRPVDVNGSDDFSTVYLEFGDNQVLSAEGFGEFTTTTWSTEGNPADGVFLSIGSFNNNLQVLTGQWLVAECSETEIILLDDNNSQITLVRECD